MFDLKQNFTEQELDNLNELFLAWTPAESEAKWMEWTEQFADTSPADEYALRHSYFRWYTAMTWDDLNSRREDYFTDFVISRQIVMALRLGIDVFDNIIWYLYQRSADPQEMRDLYAKTRDSFTASGAVVGEWQKAQYTLAEAVKEMMLIRSRGRDALEVAAFLDKIRQMMFPVGDVLAEKYFTEDHSLGVQNLLDLIDFFLDVEPEKIFIVVSTYIHPGYQQDKVEDMAVMTLPERAFPPAPATMEFYEPAVSAPETPPIIAVKPEPVVPSKITASVPANKPPRATAPALKPVAEKPSYAGIRAKIDSAFKKDADGNYSDLDGVMEALQKAADKYSDQKIAELLYWDEGKGRFEWNV